MVEYVFTAVRAKQTAEHEVFAFAAEPHEVMAIAEIERVRRSDSGELHGFQRHQVAGHIREIRDYLARADALLPNAIVLAFIDGVTIRDRGDGTATIHVEVGDNKPGFVVDGQQRLSALTGLRKPGFQVFVTALLCKDYNELRQQFVLINSTRPLPKALVYELLPTVSGLPERYTSRQFAADLVARLNHTPGSALEGRIHQHTNPTGCISDIAVQKLIMNSASDGALREFLGSPEFDERSYELINNFFYAIDETFRDEWRDMTPKTSRLVHGAGIVGMGFVMELLYSRGARSIDDFVKGLKVLKGGTAWTSGQWQLSANEVRPWNAIQNTSRDIILLSDYLVRTVRRAFEANSQLAVA